MAENTDELFYQINFVLNEQSISDLKTTVNDVSKQFATVALEGYTKGVKEVDKAVRDLVKSEQEYEKLLKETEEAEKEASKTKVEITEDAKSLLKTEKDSINSLIEKKKKLSDLTAEIKANNGGTAEQVAQSFKLKAEISALNSEISKQAKGVKSLDGFIDVLENSYQGISDKNKELAQEMKLLPLDDTTGRLKELKAEYAKNNQTLKDYDAELGNHQRNVGNYESALGKLTDKIQVFGISLGDVKEGLENTKKDLTVAKASILSFGEGMSFAEKRAKLLKIALVSSGIGLAIVAVGSLVAFLTKTQEGMDKLSEFSAGLSGAFTKLAQIISPLGKVLFKLFEDPKEAIKELGQMLLDNILNRFKAVGVILSAIVDRDMKKLADGTTMLASGIENATDKFEEMGREAKKAFDIAREGQKMLNDLNKDEIASIVTKAKLKAEIAKLKTEIEEENVTNEEKLNKIDEIIEKETQLANLQSELAELKIQALRKVGEAAENNDAENRELQEAEAEYYESQLENASRLKEITTKRTAIIRSEADKVKAIYAELENARSPKDEQKNEIVNVDQDALNEDLAFADEILKQGVANFDAAEKAKTEIANREEQLRRNLSSTGVSLAISALSSIFGESKAFAIASALNNTFQAVTATYAAYPFPFNIGLAGLVGAAGLAQVAKIKSTKKGSSSGSTSSSTTASGGNVARGSFELPTVTGQSASNPIISTSQNSINLNVENKIDREGLAIAVRQGNDEINARTVNVVSL